LTFSYDDGRFVDDQTDSEWDISGQAVTGPLEGRRLEAIPHGDIFSFAWFVTHPESLVYGE